MLSGEEWAGAEVVFEGGDWAGAEADEGGEDVGSCDSNEFDRVDFVTEPKVLPHGPTTRKWHLPVTPIILITSLIQLSQRLALAELRPQFTNNKPIFNMFSKGCLELVIVAIELLLVIVVVTELPQAVVSEITVHQTPTHNQSHREDAVHA